MDMFAKHQLKAVKIYFDSEKITILRERISVVTSLFLLSFPPTILHIYTVRAIWWFLSSLLCNYCDSPANNIKLFLSEEKKNLFYGKWLKYFLEMTVRNIRGRGRSELNSSLESQEELTSVENETDWAFPFCSTDTSHAVWLRWLRLRTQFVLTQLRLSGIMCIVHVRVSENETGRDKNCGHICMVNTTLSSSWLCSLSKENRRIIES